MDVYKNLERITEARAFAQERIRAVTNALQEVFAWTREVQSQVDQALDDARAAVKAFEAEQVGRDTRSRSEAPPVCSNAEGSDRAAVAVVGKDGEKCNQAYCQG